MSKEYKAVIGLEVHAQLSTQSKMFAPEATSYGAAPNTYVSAVTLAHPGALPTINKEAINYAIKMGLACNAEIREYNRFDRKNYFYPDLPKGYQITQHVTPICTKGSLTIHAPALKKEKEIRIRRIHLEEDTGKSLHNLIPGHTLIDLNRAGTPLIEIVSEADMEHPEEAYQYLTELRKIVRYLEICDGNMEEGSLRCDANISVMRTSDTQWGTRVEIKNLNSIRNVQLALDYEINRHIEILKQGGSLSEETRGFDAQTGETFFQRTKETLSEYRYFPEPNLPPFIVDQAWKDKVKQTMAPLPKELYHTFVHTYQLTPYDAQVLTSEKKIALFFEELRTHHPDHPKAIANWVIGPIKSYLNEQKISIDALPLSSATLAQLIQLVLDNQLAFSTAAQQLFPALIQQPTASPQELATLLGLIQTGAHHIIQPLIDQVLADYPEKVAQYQNGKKGLLGFFIQEVRIRSQNKAAPKIIAQLLQKQLDEK